MNLGYGKHRTRDVFFKYKLLFWCYGNQNTGMLLEHRYVDFTQVCLFQNQDNFTKDKNPQILSKLTCYAAGYRKHGMGLCKYLLCILS